MFLLNREMILQYKKDGLLNIEDLEEELLLPTYYYFRLGRWVTVWDQELKNSHSEELGQAGREVLSVPPFGYALVQSLERFTCSKRVLALFGQISALPRMGLRLNHSPSIDPNFPGYLEMGLENLLNHPRDVRFGECIGKILFFDVSDTYPISDIKGTIGETDYKRRETLRGPKPID